MPLFKRGQKSTKQEALTDTEQGVDKTNNHHSNSEMPQTSPNHQARPSPADPLPGAMAQPAPGPVKQQQQLVFLCQLAHGSPTGRIAGFTNVRQLYEKISDAFDMPATEILFCTLNVYKVDMARLLGGQIGLEDFIYAHIKGSEKNGNIKSEPSLGLTITDNGAGYAFIKRIKEDSIMAKMDECLVGDHIESINGKSMIGARHFEVARAFKELPVGFSFTMVLVEPRKAFTKIQPRSAAKAAPASPLVTPGSTGNDALKGKVGSGKETLRLRAKGPAEIAPVPTEFEEKAAGKVDDLLESYMGIRDLELANELVELFKGKTDFPAFTSGVTEALGEFDFPETFVFDVWGAISDAKSGRI
ncbi:LOW QUALITY PROTEIN: PDZ domain-containing protein GIPC3-like [Amphiura filiformis]|uniref:LOW QUALITY PROTEIN: PDZ domain-containing protein GIPC3-like n=1 Tax=Amphiura filiformis TaxID=82378 RepID=UPI003B227E97